jgi:zinc protease
MRPPRSAADRRRRDPPRSSGGELARVKANLGRQLSVALSQPGTLADVALGRTIYGPEPSLWPRRSGARRSSPATRSIEVKAFHAGQFGAKRAHLYIAGKFDAAR